MKLKSLLSVLFLTAFTLSCDQRAPTEPPSDDPQFAKPTCPGPHPSCKDKDDEAAYSGTNLGTLTGKKGSSWAWDVSNAPLEVAGASLDGNDLLKPVVWTETGGFDPPTNLLPGGSTEGSAFGISDNAQHIVGRLYDNDDPKPAVFRPVSQELNHLGYDKGQAGDVNSDGIIVGLLSNPDPKTAVVWNSYSDAPTVLPRPEGFTQSSAGRINNQGDILGHIKKFEPETTHVVLWHSGPDWDVCDLTPGERYTSGGGITDRDENGKVLVTGNLDYNEAVVWVVTVGTCTFEPPVTMGEWAARDVTGDEHAWKVVGDEHSFDFGKPLVWTSPPGEWEFLERSGRGYAINDMGKAVGWKRTQGIRWRDQAMLWSPTTP